MFVVIIAAKTQVDSAQECHRLVYDHAFLMVRPQEHIVHDKKLTRMTEHHYVRILAEFGQYVSCSKTGQILNQCYFLVKQHIDPHILIGFLEQNFVQSIDWIVGRPDQIELGRQPPVRNEYLTLCIVETVHNVPHVVGRVVEPAATLPASLRRIRIIFQVFLVAKIAARYGRHGLIELLEPLGLLR